MFDEKSDKWIRIYKHWSLTCFAILILGGIIFGILDLTATVDILYDDNILDLLLWTILGIVFGFSQLVYSMLIINFLNNVQIIRVEIDKIKKQSD